MVHKLLELSKQIQKNRRCNKKEKDNANIQACKKNLSYGHYIAAIHVLSSNGLLHPTMIPSMNSDKNILLFTPPIIPTEPIGVVVVSADAKEVLGVLKSFPKDTSRGSYGLRAQRLIDALSGAAADAADDLIESITGVVNLWLAGNILLFSVNLLQVPL